MSQIEQKERKIEEIADSVVSNRIAENRKKIVPMIKTVGLCGRQNIPLRGHRDSSKHFSDKSKNCGNFHALLEFRIDAGDETLKNHFKTAPKNATYISAPIQNEIIHSYKQYIQGKLLEDIRGKYFAIIADEAQDSSDSEQLSLVLRFIDDVGEIREGFMEFGLCESVTGAAIAELILDRIQNVYRLDMNLCVGQCYDGASNMSGIRSGVANIILKQFPNALYYHCASHKLNLVVASCCQIPSVRNMMDSVKKGSDIFHFSGKKQLVQEKCIHKEIPSETRDTLLDVCRTRWILRLDGMQRFEELLGAISAALDIISNDNTYNKDARSDASGLLHRIFTFDFIINLVIVRHTLAHIQPLTYELQQVKLDISAVYDAVDTCLNTLKRVREQIDLKHKSWYDHAASLAYKHNITIQKPRIVNIQMHRENYNAVTPEEYYRRSLSVPFLDQIINQLEERFSSRHRVHGYAFYAIPSCVISDKQWKQQIISFANEYTHLLPNAAALPTEMDGWETFWSGIMSKEHRVPDNIRDALTFIRSKKNWFPNMYAILAIVGTVPSSSNSCERSISKLRLLKSFLRSKMLNDRLNGLALLYIHREIDLDYEEVLDIFARNYSHRLKLIDILADDSPPSL